MARDGTDVSSELGDVQAVGKQWALWVGTQVLEQMEEPTVDVIRACSVLYFYWHSMDDHNRNTVFTSI
jgi:hypothetical protein